MTDVIQSAPPNNFELLETLAKCYLKAEDKNHLNVFAEAIHFISRPAIMVEAKL